MGSWTWAGATSPCASTLFKASISLFSSASIITAGSLVQGLVTPAVYHLRMTPPTILNAAWVQATARGFWVRLLVSPSVRQAAWTANRSRRSCRDVAPAEAHGAAPVAFDNHLEASVFGRAQRP